MDTYKEVKILLTQSWSGIPVRNECDELIVYAYYIIIKLIF